MSENKQTISCDFCDRDLPDPDEYLFGYLCDCGAYWHALILEDGRKTWIYDGYPDYRIGDE